MYGWLEVLLGLPPTFSTNVTADIDSGHITWFNSPPANTLRMERIIWVSVSDSFPVTKVNCLYVTFYWQVWNTVHLNQSKFGIFNRLSIHLYTPLKIQLVLHTARDTHQICLSTSDWSIDQKVPEVMFTHKGAAFLPCPHNTSFLHQVKTSCLSSHWMNLPVSAG